MIVDYSIHISDSFNGGDVELDGGTVGALGLKVIKQYVQKNPELILVIRELGEQAWKPVHTEKVQ